MGYPLDVNGRPIQPGQRIVYAVRQGSCSVALRPALVLTVEGHEDTRFQRINWIITAEASVVRWQGQTPRKSRVTLSYPERIAVL